MQRRWMDYAKHHWLWLSVNATGLVLMLWLLWRIWHAPTALGMVRTNATETQRIVLFSGKTALIFLVLSLSCTPLARILGVRAAITVRKSLGLWAFAFASVHALFFIGGSALLSERKAWVAMWEAIRLGLLSTQPIKVPYARVGFLALVLLIPLALTSSRRAMRLLGKNWKRLHRLVYLIALLAVWHYWWREAVAEMVPNYVQPILFAGIVAILLLARVPAIRTMLRSRRWMRIGSGVSDTA